MAKAANESLHGLLIDYDMMHAQKSINFLQRSKRIITVLSLITIDMFSLAASIALSIFIRITVLPVISSQFNRSIPDSFYSNIWWVAGIVLLCLAYEGVYSKHEAFWRETRRVVGSISLAFLIVLAIVSLAKLGEEFSRTTLLISYFFLLFILPVNKYISKNLLGRIGLWNEPVIIMGAGETGQQIACSLTSDPYLGYNVMGFLDDDADKHREGVDINGKVYSVLGNFKDAAGIIRKSDAGLVVIAVPRMPGEQLVKMANTVKHYTRSVLIVPDLMGISVTGGQLNYLVNEQILAYSTQNNLGKPLNILVKRIFDAVVGLIIFILLLPVLLLIALLIKLDSEGPVGFSHRRVGKGGREFSCYKFRTMVVNAQEMLDILLETNQDLREEWERDFKLKDDPRVTRIGKILRKTSLDELPQILNVLKGEMSLVGPRPIVWDEIPKFGEFAPDYFKVLPGMTGLWGVSGRSDIEYDERVQMETWYVKNWSLWLDISLLFKTVSVVLGRKGSY